jgi:hypothetical protein
MPRTGRPPNTWRYANAAPTVFRSPRGPTFELHRICFFPQPREANLGRAYPWRAQELASEQRGSGSAARGGAYWSRGVTRNAGADERAGAGAAGPRSVLGIRCLSFFICFKFQKPLLPRPEHEKSGTLRVPLHGVVCLLGLKASDSITPADCRLAAGGCVCRSPQRWRCKARARTAARPARRHRSTAHQCCSRRCAYWSRSAIHRAERPDSR